MIRLAITAAMLALGAGAAIATVAPAVPPPVDLSLRPVVDAGGGFVGLDYELAFRGDRDGVSDVELPNSWGGTDCLYRQITDIRATGARVGPGSGPAMRRLVHAPGAAIRLSWRVLPRQGPREAADRNDYRPIIDPDYFHVVGEAAMLQPHHLSVNHPARFRITGLPAGAAFASDMTHADAARPLRFGQLVESIAVGGAVRVLDGGDGARLALRGAFDNRTDAQWIASFRAIAAAQRRWWGTPPAPYLVTVHALAGVPRDRVSVGGTGRGDGYAFFATPNAQTDTLDLVMAHEMMHSWVPGRIGGFGPPAIEPTQYWLSEGFTEWAAWRVAVGSGQWSVEHYAGAFNGALAELAASPLRTTANGASARQFWTSAAGYRLPYLRGMVFAAHLDQLLLRRGQAGGLDAVLRGMARRVERQEAGDAVALLRRELAARGVDAAPLIARHIDGGVPVPLARDMLTPCGTIDTASGTPRLVLASGMTPAVREACRRRLAGSAYRSG